MIIGITGTLGAGKGTVAAYLTKNNNFVYLSVRNFLAAEVLRQGKMVSREAISKAANELKAAHGADYITKELLSQTLHEKHNVVVESIRTPAEAQYLQSHGAKLWAVDADAKIRYVRITEGKKDGDKITFEQFIADEKKDLANTNTPEANLLEAIHMADVTINNNGSKEELYSRIDTALQQALTQSV